MKAHTRGRIPGDGGELNEAATLGIKHECVESEEEDITMDNVDGEYGSNSVADISAAVDGSTSVGGDDIDDNISVVGSKVDIAAENRYPLTILRLQRYNRIMKFIASQRVVSGDYPISQVRANLLLACHVCTCSTASLVACAGLLLTMCCHAVTYNSCSMLLSWRWRLVQHLCSSLHREQHACTQLNFQVFVVPLLSVVVCHKPFSSDILSLHIYQFTFNRVKKVSIT